MPASPNTCTRQDGRRRSGGVCFAVLTVESVLVPEGLCRSLRAQILGNPPCINHNRDRDPVASWSRDVDTTSQARSALFSTPSATSQSLLRVRLRVRPIRISAISQTWQLPMRKISNQWGSYHPFIHACILPLTHVHASLSTPPSLITRFPDQLFLRLVSTFFDPSHPDLPCLPS